MLTPDDGLKIEINRDKNSKHIFALFFVKPTLKFYLLFILSNAKHGKSIVIGLAASSTSKGPQAKTTEPMDSIKVTYCSIQLG